MPTTPSSNPALNVPFNPVPSVSILDPNGQLNKAWRYWLMSLWERTGGNGTTTSITNIANYTFEGSDAIGDVSSQQVYDLINRIGALEANENTATALEALSKVYDLMEQVNEQPDATGLIQQALDRISELEGYVYGKNDPDYAQQIENIPTDVGSKTIVFAFSWGDAVPAPVFFIDPNLFILNVRVIIETTFDGTTPTISVGDSADNESLMPIIDNNPTSLGTYQSTPDTFYSVPTQINFYMDPGFGATQGSGHIILLVQAETT